MTMVVSHTEQDAHPNREIEDGMKMMIVVTTRQQLTIDTMLAFPQGLRELHLLGHAPRRRQWHHLQGPQLEMCRSPRIRERLQYLHLGLGQLLLLPEAISVVRHVGEAATAETLVEAAELLALRRTVEEEEALHREAMDVEELLAPVGSEGPRVTIAIATSEVRAESRQVALVAILLARRLQDQEVPYLPRLRCLTERAATPQQPPIHALSASGLVDNLFPNHHQPRPPMAAHPLGLVLHGNQQLNKIVPTLPLPISQSLSLEASLQNR